MGHSMLDFEKQFIVSPPVADREMGFLPLLAAAIPMATSLAGSLLSRKSKSGPPPEAAQAQNVLDILTKAIGADESSGENSIKEVVKNIVSTVPSPVVGQVKKAIHEMKNAEKAGIQRQVSMANTIDARFRPKIPALVVGLGSPRVQTNAKDQNKRILSKQKFRNQTTQSLAHIIQKLNRIEKRLNTSAIVNENRIALFGGRQVLER